MVIKARLRALSALAWTVASVATIPVMITEQRIYLTLNKPP